MWWERPVRGRERMELYLSKSLHMFRLLLLLLTTGTLNSFSSKFSLDEQIRNTRQFGAEDSIPYHATPGLVNN